MIGHDLSTALELLAEAIAKINEAIEHQRSSARIQADDAMQQVQVLLPELFFCRSLGDGFGTIVNSLFHGLHNLDGKPLTEPQILATRTALMAIRNEPFIGFDDAIKHVASLKLLSLKIMPRGTETIDEAIDHLNDPDDENQDDG